MPPKTNGCHSLAHKSLVLLAGVVLLQVLLLAVQIKRDSQGRLIRAGRSGNAFRASRCQGRRRNSRDLGSLLRQNASRENEQLRRDNDTLKLQLNQLQSKAAEAERLAVLLNFRQSHQSIPMLGARVIGASADTASQTIYLDRGERDGIRRNMAVITPDGVVGKIIESYRPRCCCGTDTVGPRRRWIHAYTAAMKHDDAANLGDHVITSGMDRILPAPSAGRKPCPRSRMESVQANSIRPAANLEVLEEVIVLLSLQPLDLKKDAGTPAAEARGRAHPAKARRKAMNDTYDLRMRIAHRQAYNPRVLSAAAKTPIIALFLQKSGARFFRNSRCWTCRYCSPFILGSLPSTGLSRRHGRLGFCRIALAARPCRLAYTASPKPSSAIWRRRSAVRYRASPARFALTIVFSASRRVVVTRCAAQPECGSRCEWGLEPRSTPSSAYSSSSSHRLRKN